MNCVEDWRVLGVYFVGSPPKGSQGLSYEHGKRDKWHWSGSNKGSSKYNRFTNGV